MRSCLIIYVIIILILIALELFYFRVADKLNIIDKPNQRSSHSSIVLRGGGIISCLVCGYGARFSSSITRCSLRL